MSAGSVGPSFLSGRPWVHNDPLFPRCSKELPQERRPRLDEQLFWVQGEHLGLFAVSVLLRRSEWAQPGREKRAVAGNPQGHPTSSLKEWGPGVCNTRHCAF